VSALRPGFLLLLVAAVQCAALFLSLPAWRASGHARGAARGARGIAFLAAGFALLAARGSLSGALSIVAANACVALGVSLGYDALRELFELPPTPTRERGLVLAGLAGLALGWAVDPSEGRVRYASWRVLGHAIALGTLHAGWAVTLWRRAPRPWALSVRYVFAASLSGLSLSALQLLWAVIPGVPRDPLAGPILPAIAALVTTSSLLVTIGAVLQVEARERERLLDANAQLRRDAQTDPLTGLANRRHLEAVAALEIARARRWGAPMAVLMIDADHFKSINDRFGHGAGDEVLRELAARCARAIRSHDVLARWGGEEFVALLPKCDLAAAKVVAARMLAAVREGPMDAIGERVTVSIGVAPFTPEDRELGPVVDRADQALYRAKREGRDRCAVHGDAGTSAHPTETTPG
jgi:diguanylate cyclase (GGDEF)-like protein